MRHLKIFEDNNNLPTEYVDFIVWLAKNTTTSERRRFAYNDKKESWVDLKDYYTYYTCDELFIIYKSEKYNL